MDFFLYETVISNVPHSGEEVSYGLLVRDEIRYQYFGPTFESQMLAFKSNIALRLRQPVVSETEESEMSFHLSVLVNNTWVMCVPIVLIVCFGCVFQSFQKRREKLKQNRLTLEA